MDIVTLTDIETPSGGLPPRRVVTGVPDQQAAALIAAGKARAARDGEASLCGPLTLAWPTPQESLDETENDHA